jgi:hypothetical protein
MAFLIPVVMLMANVVMSAYAHDAPSVATFGLPKSMLRHVQVILLGLLLAVHIFVLTSALTS